MKMNKKKIALLMALAMVIPVFTGCVEKFQEVSGFSMETIDKIKSERQQDAVPIIVSKDNPFYALIATPASLYYEGKELHVMPLLVENLSNPSKPVVRFQNTFPFEYKEIGDDSPENISKELSQIWKKSDAAILIEDSFNGYKLGINLVPLASYLDIPVFVTKNTKNIRKVLNKLGVDYTFVCGDIDGYGMTWRFESVDEILDFMIDFVKSRFGSVDYITMANPLDVKRVAILNETSYDYENVTSSVDILPAQTIHALTSGLFSLHEFNVPYPKYARLKIDLINKASEYVSELGDDMILLVYGPDNETYVYTSTAAGIPDYNGNDIATDKVHYETIIYGSPGKYTAQVMGRWVERTSGEYELKIKVEEVNDTLEPLMKNLSSMAPYLAAYHHGIVFASPHFAFAGNESIGVKGVVYPSTNEGLVEPCNEHLFRIHEELNSLLGKIANISANDTRALHEYYTENPIYIAIIADPTMIPMFYYHNPDSDNIIGVQLPSDFFYGDVDPSPSDWENDSYTYYPTMENAVGRVTGYDAEDCSALIARTIFYNELINKLGDWKNNASVQTGAGLEFQWVPILTTLAGLVTGSEEPTKWPSGESLFANMHISDLISNGGFNVKSTILTISQREGFDNIAKYTSRLNIPFPMVIQLISGKNVVKGGDLQRNSNFIFVFNHGIYYLYESGDILLDSRGFPPVTWLARFLGPLGIMSGLSSKGAYAVRYVYNDEYGPSVIFIESCIVGRTDGLLPQNCLSQAYLHAGVNSVVASTRVTADPGYLEPGLIFKGFGAWGFIHAWLRLLTKGEYPDLHFGGVVAHDFINDLINNDSTVGMALRNAKNKYLHQDANSTFLWTPPLNLVDLPGYNHKTNTLRKFEYDNYLDKKYVCLHEFNLYGDPAFNPYQPVNNG